MRACDAYHPGQAFAGQRRVERQAGRPRLQCGKKGDDQPLRTFHENPDDIAAACARLPQAGRQTGRLPVQFAAGEGHRSVPQGGGVRHAARPLCENLGDRNFAPDLPFRRAKAGGPPVLKRDVGDPFFRIFRRFLEKPGKPAGHDFDGSRFENVGVARQIPPQFPVPLVQVDFEVEAHRADRQFLP